MKNRRMLLQTVILIIISFALSTLISVNSLNTVIDGNNEEMSKVLASNIYDSLNNMLVEPIIVSQTMSNDYFMIDLLENEDFPGDMEDELISYLQTISGGMNYNSAFIVSEKSRTYYTQKGFNKIVSPETDAHDIWYSLFVDSGKKYDFDVDTDEVHENAWTVFVNCRIEDENGELLGVCGVSVVMTELQDILCSYEEEYGVKINLVNQEGLVQVDTDMINIENAVLNIDIPKTNDSTAYVYQKESDGSYSVSKYVDSLSWYLVVQSDGENDNQIYANLIYKNIITFIIILTVCIVIVASNITIEKKKMEEYALEKEQYAKEQEELKAQAEQANKAKGSFLANMSHEIRTPINTVLGMNEMIMRESSEKQIIDYAANIQSAGRSLLSIINDILDFSKIESGKMEIVPVSYEVSSLVNDIVNMIKIRAEKKQLKFIYEIDENIPSVLYGDDVRIRQVITNILTNAVKYTHEGYIRFRMNVLNTENGTVRLAVSVTDTGIGIKEEDMEKLFASFQRLDQERNRSIEGTGLGIPIVQRLLGLMGSELKVSSVYGSGSTFSFEIEQKIVKAEPIGDFEQRFKVVAATEHDSDAIVRIAPDARVLVVDDNETNLLVAKSLLKRTKVKLDTATSGAKCIELLKNNRYDIVFLDHMMPEMDGIQTLKKIKEENIAQDTCFIALTANAIHGARQSYLDAGFDDYLSKPFSGADIEKCLFGHIPAGLCKEEKQIRDGKGVKTGEELDEPETNTLFSPEEGTKYTGGDSHAYDEILAVYVSKASEISERIERLFREKDWKNYIIEVHALKSSSLTIGSKQLSELAKELELSGKAGNYAVIEEKNGELLELYKKVAKLGKEYLGETDTPKEETPAENEQLTEIAAEKAKESLGMIKDACLSFDADNAEKLCSELGGCSVNGRPLRSDLNEIVNAVNDFEYEAAAEMAEKLAESL